MESIYSLESTCPNPSYGTAGCLFSSLVNTIYVAQCCLAQIQYYPDNYAEKLFNHHNFDFIVVGAGSAGSVVANRLTENAKWKVLLLEAGGIPSVTSMIPQLFFTTLLTKEDWQYYDEPSPNSCLGFKNGQCYRPRGKGLGGTGIMSAGVYSRGKPSDYNRWASLGNEGWDWESVFPYFIKSEKTLVEEFKNDPNHGTGGYLVTSFADSDQKINGIVFDAARELGYPIGKDEIHYGYYKTLQNIEEGEKRSSSRAFLAPIADRPNLYIATHAQVSRVLMDDQTKTAYGVEVKIGDNLIKVLTEKEVILSAGAINSPQLLMNSGIGPKEHLESLGINVIENLQVGGNLQDHISFPWMSAKVNQEAISDINVNDELFKYYANKTGEFGTTSTNLEGFINTRYDSEEADVQIEHAINLRGTGSSNLWNLNDVTFKGIEEDSNNYNYLTLFPLVINPKSRGQILLRSNDPFDKPRIISGFFTDENKEDFEILYGGIQYARKLFSTKVFQKYEAQLLFKNVPGCSQYDFDTESYWRCLVTHIATALYHPVGSCKMGPSSDGMAVVDDTLRVHGVRNLRVVDASIMPYIVSANPNAAVVMVGEKGSDMIKDDWTE